MRIYEKPLAEFVDFGAEEIMAPESNVGGETSLNGGSGGQLPPGEF